MEILELLQKPHLNIASHQHPLALDLETQALEDLNRVGRNRINDRLDGLLALALQQTHALADQANPMFDP